MSIMEKVKAFHTKVRDKYMTGHPAQRFLTNYISLPSYTEYGLDPKNEGRVMTFLVGDSEDRQDLSLLPGGLNVLEHIVGTLHYEENQEFLSHQYSICTTLNQVYDHRKLYNTSRHMVKTIILGKSTIKEITNFQASITETIDSLKTGNYWLPLNHIVLAVEYTTGVFKGVFSSRMPTRIMFGYWGRRWEIVIPWVISNDPKLKNNLNLDIEDRLPLSWKPLFTHLPGFVTGIKIIEDLRNIASFLRMLPLTHWDGSVSLKAIDLATLLALAGYNAPVTYDNIGFIFTSEIFYDLPSYVEGYNMYHKPRLPLHLDCCLQMKINIVMNASVLSMLSYLIRVFPVPSVCSVASKKPIEKFMMWYSDFIYHTLYGCELDPKHFLNSDFATPQDRMNLVDTQNCGISSEDLDKLIPLWNNVTYGGCTTDAISLCFIMEKFIPILEKPFYPKHLSWNICPKTILAVFGTPTGQSNSIEKLGLLPDSSVPVIPPLVSEEDDIKVMNAIKTFKNTLPDTSPIKKLSQSQLLLTHTWTNLHLCIRLYGRTLRIPYCHKMFKGKDPNTLPCSYDTKDLKIVDCFLSIAAAFCPKTSDNPFTIEQGRINRVKITKKIASMQKLKNSGVLTKHGKAQLKRLTKSNVVKSPTPVNSCAPPVRDNNEAAEMPDHQMAGPDDVEIEINIPQDLTDEQLMKCDYF